MEQADKELVAKQAELEILAAKKALERRELAKLRAERPKSKDSKKPAKKKQKVAPSIPFTERDLEEIKIAFWTTLQYLPPVNKSVLYSGLTNEIMCFSAYPIIIKEFTKKDGPLPIDSYILGVTKPQAVLHTIRSMFNKLYPDSEPADYNLWELYRWNRAYYGSKVENVSFSIEYNALEMLESKPFGGNKEVPSINMKVESTLFRHKKYSKSVPKYIKEKFTSDDSFKQCLPPARASPYPEEFLTQVAEKIRDLKKREGTGTKKSKDALSTDDMKLAFDNLNADDEGHSDVSEEDSD